MTTAEFKRLKNLLMRAAATDSDPELVQCFRRASALLAMHGHTWAAALDRVVRVVDPVARDGFDDQMVGIHPRRTADDDEDWPRLFEDAMAGAGGDFLVTLESIRDRWERLGGLTPRQREVVRDAAERYAARYPGGRVR